jgi:GNAT superfamily N-acetyltransferase
MTQILRKLTRSDYDQYYPLINEFRETSFTKEEFEQYMDTLPSNMSIYVLVVEDQIVSTTTVIYEPKLIFNRCTFAHVEDVCTLKQHQGKGYGSILLQHVVADAKARGCYKITLVCNPSVLPFYIKNNFEQRGIQCSQLL